MPRPLASLRRWLQRALGLDEIIARIDEQGRTLTGSEAAQIAIAAKLDELYGTLAATAAAPPAVEARLDELMRRASALGEIMRTIREAQNDADAHHVGLMAALLNEQKRIGAELAELRRQVRPPVPGRRH